VRMHVVLIILVAPATVAIFVINYGNNRILQANRPENKFV